MKKILFALLALFFVNTLSASNTASTAEGGTYEVIIKVQITYKYYEDKYFNKCITSTSGGEREMPFTVHAETPDEAEAKAKSQCMAACKTNGQYIGTKSYGGKTVYVMMYRKILTARATPISL